MQKAKREKQETPIFIQSNDMLTVTTSGHVIEATYRNVAPTPEGGYIEKMDDDHYIVKRTGEICEYTHAEDRSGNVKSLYRTFAHIRRLVNANTTVPARCKWITITYEDRTVKGKEGAKRLYKDFLLFNRKLQRRWGKAEYISVVEPQGDGTWHMHIIYIWDKPAPYVPQDEFQALWGKGYCWLTKMSDNDNLGAYLSAYLGNASQSEIDDHNKEASEAEKINYSEDDLIVCNVKDQDGNIEQKKFIKGLRLSMYPNEMNIVRHSKGIKMPKREMMTKARFDIRTALLEPVYDTSYTTTVEDSDGELRVIEMRQMQYNTKRRRKR